MKVCLKIIPGTFFIRDCFKLSLEIGLVRVNGQVRCSDPHRELLITSVMASQMSTVPKVKLEMENRDG